MEELMQRVVVVERALQHPRQRSEAMEAHLLQRTMSAEEEPGPGGDGTGAASTTAGS